LEATLNMICCCDERANKAMRLMVFLSLLINVAVLLPVCVGLLTNASWTTSAYGEATPARAILLSIYLAIGLVSVLLPVC